MRVKIKSFRSFEELLIIVDDKEYLLKRENIETSFKDVSLSQDEFNHLRKLSSFATALRAKKALNGTISTLEYDQEKLNL